MTDRKGKDIDLLYKKRASYKGRLSAFVEFVSGLKQPLNRSQVHELQLKVDIITKLYVDFDAVQLNLECSVGDADIELQVREEFESAYSKVVADAKLLMPSDDTTNIKCERGSRVNNGLVKLPTIQLPRFNGSYDDWLEFRDTFSSLIHSNDDIDDINKFHYLRASLQGTAAVVVQSINLSSSNYMIAWRTLCDRFDNKRLLIQNHVAALFEMESIMKESSFSIKRMIDQVNKNLRALDSLGQPITHWDTLLIHVITRKLDVKTFREWEEYKSCLDADCSITLTNLFAFLQSRGDLLETLEMSSNKHSVPGQCKINNRNKSMVALTDSLDSRQSVSSSASNYIQPCPKCKGVHLLRDCSQFLSLSVDQRLKLLPELKVCFNCFRTGHYAHRCHKPGCTICKHKHNTLVHSADTQSPQVNASDDDAAAPDNDC